MKSPKRTKRIQKHLITIILGVFVFFLMTFQPISAYTYCASDEVASNEVGGARLVFSYKEILDQSKNSSTIKYNLYGDWSSNQAVLINDGTGNTFMIGNRKIPMNKVKLFGGKNNGITGEVTIEHDYYGKGSFDVLVNSNLVSSNNPVSISKTFLLTTINSSLSITSTVKGVTLALYFDNNKITSWVDDGSPHLINDLAAGSEYVIKCIDVPSKEWKKGKETIKTGKAGSIKEFEYDVDESTSTLNFSTNNKNASFSLWKGNKKIKSWSHRKSITIKGLKNNTKYIIKCDSVPDGYKECSNIEFTTGVASQIEKSAKIESIGAAVDIQISEELKETPGLVIGVFLKGEQIATLRNSWKLEDLIPGETYELRAIEVPKGYTAFKPVTIVAGEKQSTLDVDLKITKSPKINIKANVAGCTMALVDNEGQIVEQWNEIDHLIEEGLFENADYSIQLLNIPKGYEVVETKKITTGKALSLTSYDVVLRELPKAEISIIDSKGNALENVKVQINKYRDSQLIETFISDNKDYDLLGLEVGETYSINVLEVPEGYKVKAGLSFVAGNYGEDIKIVMTIEKIILTEELVDKLIKPIGIACGLLIVAVIIYFAYIKLYLKKKNH